MSCFCRKLAEPLIRPPRSTYSLEDLDAGQPVFRLDELVCQRDDFAVLNRNGLKLAGSIYRPRALNTRLPCVVYLHGNIGSRLSSMCMVEAVLSRGMSLVCFDFSGCGHSEGDYISLGFHQHLDIRYIVDYLKRQKNFSKFLFWGRSMGAVAAIRFQEHFKEGMGLVLDSPFADFSKLAVELVEKESFFLGLFSKTLLKLVCYGTEQRININLSQFKPVESAKAVFCPIYFIASEDDEIVGPSHVQAYYDQCSSLKKHIKVLKGGHNEGRSQELISSILEWLLNDTAEDCINTESTVAGIQDFVSRSTRRLTDESTWGSFFKQ